MNKFIAALFIALAFSSSHAFAETYTHTCNLVDDFDDWTVRVGTAQSEFFDNNSNCTMIRMGQSESSVIFKSTPECGYQKVLFSYDKATQKAFLYFPKGLTDEEDKLVYKFDMTCTEGAFQD